MCWNAAGGVRDRGDVEREFVEVGEGVVFVTGFEIVGLVGFVETEVEVGCFGRGGSLGRTCGVCVERAQV